MKVKFFAAFLGVLFFAMLVLLSTNGYAMSSKPGARLDTETKECIKCHKMDIGKHFGPSHASHIVGTDYVNASKLDPSLVPAGKLDPRIRLVKGRVSCITCHISYIEETHMDSIKDRESAEAKAYPMLRVDNSGSGLCLKCHRK